MWAETLSYGISFSIFAGFVYFKKRDTIAGLMNKKRDEVVEIITTYNYLKSVSLDFLEKEAHAILNLENEVKSIKQSMEEELQALVQNATNESNTAKTVYENALQEYQEKMQLNLNKEIREKVVHLIVQNLKTRLGRSSSSSTGVRST